MKSYLNVTLSYTCTMASWWRFLFWKQRISKKKNIGRFVNFALVPYFFRKYNMMAHTFWTLNKNKKYSNTQLKVKPSKKDTWLNSKACVYKTILFFETYGLESEVSVWSGWFTKSKERLVFVKNTLCLCWCNGIFYKNFWRVVVKRSFAVLIKHTICFVCC